MRSPERTRIEFVLALFRLFAAGFCSVMALVRNPFSDAHLLLFRAIRDSTLFVAVIYSIVMVLLTRRELVTRTWAFGTSILDAVLVAASVTAFRFSPGITTAPGATSPAFGLFYVIIFASILRRDPANTITVSVTSLTLFAASLAGTAGRGASIAGNSIWDGVGRLAALAGAGVLAVIAARMLRADSRELEAAERELAASELRMRNITGALPAVIFQLIVTPDRNVRFTYVSDSCSALLGVDPVRFVRGDGVLESIVEARSLARIRAELESMVYARTTWSAEAEMKSADGAYRWYKIATTPAAVGSDYTLVNGLLLDIQQTKDIEERLRMAREEAVRATELKSEFVANMSHELRTPLNGIIGMSDLLMKTGLNNVQQDYAATVRSSAEALLSIINDILDISRIEAGRLLFEESEFSLRSVVYQIAAMLSPEAEARGLDFLVEIEPGIPDRLIGDAGRLSQILVNIVGNAVKFTASGYVTVEVAKHLCNDDRCTVAFRCIDTGPGIPEGDVARIFAKFEQGHDEATRRRGGTGLGLSITRELVTLMGGDLSVSSRPGVGSTFTAVLDFRRVENSSGDRPAAPEADSPPSGGKAIVLDDRPVRRESTIRVLEAEGYAVASGGDLDASLFEAAGRPGAIGFVAYSLLSGHREELEGFVAAAPGGVSLCICSTIQERIAASDAAESCGLPYAPFPLRHDDIVRVASSERHRGVEEIRRPESTAAVQGALDREAGEPGPTVLVADDNETNRRVTARMVERCGCRVVLAAGGNAAVEAGRKKSFDLILLDFRMPDANGLAVATALRADSANQETPIVIASGQEISAEEFGAYPAARVDAWLSKPVRLTEVESLVRRFVASP